YEATFSKVVPVGAFTLEFFPVSMEQIMDVGPARLKMEAKRSGATVDVQIVRPADSAVVLPDDDSQRRLGHSALETVLLFEVADDGTLWPLASRSTTAAPAESVPPNPVIDALDWMSKGIDLAGALASQLIPVLPARAVAEGAEWHSTKEFDVFGVHL